MIIFWIIVSIVLFSIIVLVHELGHFISARFFWIKVEEFWLWIPPRAKKLFKDKKWTLFTLNWLPIWWFVRLKWENSKELKDKKAKDALINISNYKQSIIILWWVFMNFVLATIIFSILFFVWVKPVWVNTKIETNLNIKIIPTYDQAINNWFLVKNPWIILSPIKWSIAKKVWIKKWDILLSINEQKIDIIEKTIDIISNNAWKEITFEIISINEKKELNYKKIKITPSKDWKIWSYLSENININKDFKYKYSFISSIKYGILETYNQSILTLKWLTILFRKIFIPKTQNERQEAISQVSGPIWIVDFITNSIKWWFVFLLIIWAIISINLWVFNLLPIPALDWWRFVFIVINWVLKWIFWKKVIKENIEWLIHLWFFMVLIALSFVIMYNDIMKIF